MAEDQLRDACGLFGCALSRQNRNGLSNPALVTYEGLLSLQHRGQEGTGMVASNAQPNSSFVTVRGKGLVREAFTDEHLRQFDGTSVCIGHNRYSTAGLKDAVNCIQPYVVYTCVGQIAVAHNGELENSKELRKEVLKQCGTLSTDTDSELIAQILGKALSETRAHDPDDSFDRRCDITGELRIMMERLTLSYALLVMTADRVYAMRDPWGNRPLCVGAIPDSAGSATASKAAAWVVASETCALDPLGARFLKEVQPGEIVRLGADGFVDDCANTQRPVGRPMAFCVFEYVYFARSSSWFQGQQVNFVRQRCGQLLAMEHPVEADIVSTVPESASAAALGYATQSGIAFAQVLQKNAYIGRTFIQPTRELRQRAVLRKFSPLACNFAGKRVVLVDDSIVRGNTMKPLVELLRRGGASEVHLRIASPPIRYTCHMGVNIPRRDELIAARASDEQIAAAVGADSLRYLSIKGLLNAVETNAHKPTGHCTACLSGDYPVPRDHMPLIDF